MAEQPHGQRGLWSVGRNQPYSVKGDALDLPDLEIPGLSLCVRIPVFPSQVEGRLLPRNAGPSPGSLPAGGSGCFLEGAHRLSVDLHQRA